VELIEEVEADGPLPREYNELCCCGAFLNLDFETGAVKSKSFPLLAVDKFLE